MPSYDVARAARERVTVALSGDGADELFAGYEWRYGLNLLESRVRQGIPRWGFGAESSVRSPGIWPRGTTCRAPFGGSLF